MKLVILFLLLTTGCATISSPTGPAFDFKFLEVRSFLDASVPRAPEVLVAITRIDPELGLVQWKGFQVEGDTLGHSQLGSIHRVFSPKQDQFLDINFDTGAVLEKVVVGRLIPTRFKKCPDLIPSLRLDCLGPYWVQSLYAVDEISYTDREGRQWTVRIPETMPALDDLCCQHGGRRELRRFSDEEEEAAWLLWQADDNWHSRNPKVRAMARDAYRRLLKEFSLESAVTRNLVRIKARAEAEIEN